jgi:hypothetical protein
MSKLRAGPFTRLHAVKAPSPTRERVTLRILGEAVNTQ